MSILHEVRAVYSLKNDFDYHDDENVAKMQMFIFNDLNKMTCLKNGTSCSGRKCVKDGFISEKMKKISVNKNLFILITR